jgi:hypothetical protein
MPAVRLGFPFHVTGVVSAAIERNAVQMSPKQQKTSIMEILESRQFLSAAPTVDADAALAASAGKVSMQDFHFVQRANKASPELSAARIKLTDLLISSRGGSEPVEGKVSTQDFHFVMKVNKPSPKLTAEADSAAGISIVAKPTKHTPGLAKVRFSDIPIVA